MATLERSPHAGDRSAVREPRATEAEITEDELTVHLEDGRTVTTPLEWYPRLVFGTPAEREDFEIAPGGYGLHWPALDEDLSVKGMLAGRPAGEGAQSLKGWKGAMRERRRLRAEGEEPPAWGTGPYRIPYRAFWPEDA